MRKAVKAGNIVIGGGAPISVQSMTNTKASDVAATLAQIRLLHAAGADLVRVSLPDQDAVEAFKIIVPQSPLPLIADIHFDYKLALAAIGAGAAKIRINPSNFGKVGLAETAKTAKEAGIPIRVGVNQGSVQKDVSPAELAGIALDAAKALEDLDFFDIVLAVKSSDVRHTVAAYRELAARCDYPLHIGLTESGTPDLGQIKSAVAIGSLLLDGIGDTIRVSLAAPPQAEVEAGIKILRATGLRRDFVEVIACPTCARAGIDVAQIASELEKGLQSRKTPLKIAVMGCVVNGIGKSKGADLGVCGGKDKSAIFLNKEIIATVPNDQIVATLMRLAEEHQ